MKMKCMLVAACYLPLGLMAQQGFTIKGTLGLVDAPTKAYLTYRNDTTKITDSVVLNKGSFTFRGKLSAPTEAYLTIQHDNLHFYIENTTISITATDSIGHAAIKGAAINDEDKALRALQQPYRKTADSIMKVYYARTPEERADSNWKKAIGAVMSASQKGYDSVSRAFISQHLHSYISLVAFQQFELAYNFNPDTAAAKLALFPQSLRNTTLGKKYLSIIDTGRKTNIGVMAMDFTQNDSTGTPVKLSDYRGHYVLVDFWASWCKPCRAENPNLLAAYKKFKDKNFTILGVSLDDEKSRLAWLHAVAKDSLPWTQVSELKGFSSKAAELYGVVAIPTNFLIDPNGKIIARNLRGEELDKKLNTLFNL